MWRRWFRQITYTVFLYSSNKWLMPSKVTCTNVKTAGIPNRVSPAANRPKVNIRSLGRCIFRIIY